MTRPLMGDPIVFIPNWIKNGKKAINERAIEMALDILNTYNPEPLPEGVKDDFDNIWEDLKKKMRR